LRIALVLPYEQKPHEYNSVIKELTLNYVATLAEVAATSALKVSDQFSKLMPSIVVVLGMALRSIS